MYYESNNYAVNGEPPSPPPAHQNYPHAFVSEQTFYTPNFGDDEFQIPQPMPFQQQHYSDEHEHRNMWVSSQPQPPPTLPTPAHVQQPTLYEHMYVEQPPEVLPSLQPYYESPPTYTQLSTPRPYSTSNGNLLVSAATVTNQYYHYHQQHQHQQQQQQQYDQLAFVGFGKTIEEIGQSPVQIPFAPYGSVSPATTNSIISNSSSSISNSAEVVSEDNNSTDSGQLVTQRYFNNAPASRSPESPTQTSKIQEEIGLPSAASPVTELPEPGETPNIMHQTQTKIKKKRKPKRDPNQPQKPISAYALFFRDAQAEIKEDNPTATFGEISKTVALLWDSLEDENKNVYKRKTEAAKKEYLKALAAYQTNNNQADSSKNTSAENMPHSQSKLKLKDNAPANSSHNQHNLEQQTNSIVVAAPSKKKMPQQSPQNHLAGQQDPVYSKTIGNHSEFPRSQTQIQVNDEGVHRAPLLTNGIQIQRETAVPPRTYNNNNNYQTQQLQQGAEVAVATVARTICIRVGCTNIATTNQDWDDEYCSSDCVVTHCREAFTSWVSSNQNAHHLAKYNESISSNGSDHTRSYYN